MVIADMLRLLLFFSYMIEKQIRRLRSTASTGS